jgi:CelD/BcsL family acetyltransferase involved in cellulose biosynthesis
LIRLIHSVRAFDAVGPDWDELYRRRDVTNLFVTHRWLRNWVDCFAPSFAAVIDRSAAGIDAGLVVHRDRTGWRALGDHSYRPDVLTLQARDAAMAPMLRALERRARGPVIFEGMARDICEALSAGRLMTVARFPRELRAVDTTGTYDDYLAARPKKVRAELRRKRRKLEREVDGIELRIWREPAAMDRAFAAVLEVESDSWKDGAATSIASSDNERRFYRGVLDLFGPDTEPRVYALVSGDTAIAFVLGVAHREIFYALKCSYRSEYAPHSPGGNVFSHVIEDICPDPALERIELLGTDARWKREMADIADPVSLLEVRRQSLGALLRGVEMEHLRPRLKTAITAVRGWLKR